MGKSLLSVLLFPLTPFVCIVYLESKLFGAGLSFTTGSLGTTSRQILLLAYWLMRVSTTQTYTSKTHPIPYWRVSIQALGCCRCASLILWRVKPALMMEIYGTSLHWRAEMVKLKGQWALYRGDLGLVNWYSYLKQVIQCHIETPVRKTGSCTTFFFIFNQCQVTCLEHHPE